RRGGARGVRQDAAYPRSRHSAVGAQPGGARALTLERRAFDAGGWQAQPGRGARSVAPREGARSGRRGVQAHHLRGAGRRARVAAEGDRLTESLADWVARHLELLRRLHPDGATLDAVGEVIGAQAVGMEHIEALLDALEAEGLAAREVLVPDLSATLR